MAPPKATVPKGDLGMRPGDLAINYLYRGKLCFSRPFKFGVPIFQTAPSTTCFSDKPKSQ